MIAAGRLHQFLGAGLRVGGLGMRFVLMFVLARALTLESFGLFGLYVAAIQLAASLVVLDVYAQTTRQILSLQGDAVRDVLRRHWGAVVFAIAILAPLASLLFHSALPDNAWVLPALFLVHVMIDAVATDTARLLIPLGRPLVANIVVFLRTGAWSLPVIIVSELTSQQMVLITVVLWWIAGSAASVVFAVAVAGPAFRLVPKIDWSWIGRALRTSVLFFMATLAYRAVLGLDKFIVQWVLGLDELGVYTLYAGVAIGVLGIVEAGISAWRFPQLVADIQARNALGVRRKLKTFFVENAAATTAVMIALAVIFPVIAPRFLDPVFSRQMGGYFVILTGVWAYCVSLPFHYTIYGFGRDKVLLGIYLAALVVMMAWGFGVMPGMGIWAACIMLALALIFIALLRVFFALKLLRTLPVADENARGAADLP